MEYFGSVESIEQLKAEYLAYLRKWKGSAMMDEVKKQYEDLLFTFGVEVNKQIDEQNKNLSAEYQKPHYDASKDRYAETLEKIIDFNMTIEIIGQWIWCFDSKEYKDQLKEYGFWFSASKKAWVYSGSPKKHIRSHDNVSDLRRKWGSEQIKEKEEA